MPMATNDDCAARAKGSNMATLRRPVQVVKKRSGPLEDALNELNRLESSKSMATPAKQTDTTTSSPVADVAGSGSAAFTPTASSRRRATIKEKDKKRERWLLTRKTWKYMADAGRKLIPEGAQNRKEDIPKIEAHFQHVCASEMRFVLWRRKLSYPGATKTTRSRYKTLLRRSKRAQTPSAIEQEEANNANYTIELLQSYLKLNECYKTTTLLGSKTVRPDQTASPSAQRPGGRSTQTMASVSLRGPGFMTTAPTKAPEQQLSEMDQLLVCLSQSAQSGKLPVRAESITPAILEDKALLKQIYNTLKKQQLHRILSNHSTLPSKPKSNLTSAVSLSSLFHFGGNGAIIATNDRGSTSSLAGATIAPGHFTQASQRAHDLPGNNLYSSESYTNSGATKKRQRKPPTTLDLKPNIGEPAKPATPARRKAAVLVEKQYNSCGAQTNFIQLSEIKRLAEEYKARKREEALDQASGGGTTPAATDDESEKPNASGSGSANHHRRKSSIDNEDVSQSVSDTIKRYLRMARKKSVHDADSANRFKRVNYDRNLRNIRAKGEINPPGMDEGLNKAVQTLDAWPLITLEFIRGNECDELLECSHAEWQKMLDERIQKKLEYEQKLQKQHEECAAGNLAGSPPPASSCPSRSGQIFNQSVSSCSSSTSAPTSPTMYEKHASNVADSAVAANLNHAPQLMTPQTHGPGNIFVSGSHFLSNLWHGNTSSSSSATSPTSYQQQGKNDNSLQIDAYKNGQANMQKSKSSSNVGQFVTRKILRSRSKSQTRPSVSPPSKWAPCDNNKWTSENGESVQLTDTALHKLTNIEAKLLQRVAIEKINELNIGVSLNFDAKSNKRRILPKKKAITTSFFDIGKKDEQSARNSVFGNSLECCVENDRKRYTNLNANTERGSRTSLISLFRGGGGSGGGNASKLNENVRSCESLPSSAVEVATAAKNVTPNINKSTSGYFSNLKKVASVQMSRSQSDMRRKSQEYDDNYEPIADYTECCDTDLQVPTFITSCIKYLEEQGLQKVGLFRVSTSKKRVKQMREVFDKHTSSAIEPDTCPHDVATLLKEFLRDLPEPLLCNHLYQAFLKTQKIRNRRLQLEAISHLIKLLPPTHRDTLYVLLKFLAKVAASSDDVLHSDGQVQISGNKMDSNNLATVFAPNMLRTTRKVNESTREDDASEKESMCDAINVIRIMIDHFEEIFKVPAELVDVVYSHMLDECPEHLFALCEQRSTAGRSSDIEYETAPEKPARRLYTRESVMHQNDASKAPDAFANGTRESKRHSDGHAHATTTNDYGLHKSTLLEGRRLSTPILVDKGGGIACGDGVLSASLQITVPKQISAMSTHAGPAYDPNDLDDVFIDVPQSPAYNETEGLMEGFYESANQQQAPQSEQRSTDANTFRSRRSSLTQTNAAQSATTSSAKHNKLPSNEHEPKAPTSISSIGGAILRSKTADFEKMSTKIPSSFSTRTTTSPPSELAMRMQVSSDASPASAAQRQHLYKRQQLIPSAKRFITTPADKKQK